MRRTEGPRVWASWLPVVVLAACNGRFDFDTESLASDASAARDSDLASSDRVQIGSTEDGPIARLSDSSTTDAERSTAGMISCGVEVCASSSQRCCATPNGSQCIGTTVACQGAQIQCDGPSDCVQGKACCVEVRAGQVAQVECEDAASCLSKGHLVLCDPSDPSACGGTSCVPITQSPLPAGYHQCL